MNDDPAPTSNLDAERYTLAAMMSSPQAVDEAAEIVQPSDFLRPLHQDIFLAIVCMASAREPVTPVTLRAWMERDRIKVDPLYLADIYGLPVPGPMGAAHARIVWDCSVRRRMAETFSRITQQSASLAYDPAELVAEAQRLLDGLAAGSVPDGNQALTTDQFLALDNNSTRPVIPGLLWHEDRVVVVGSEGDGKTTLAHQVAYALGAGVHPFVPSEQIPPGRALIVDLENPRALLQPRLSELRTVAARQPGWSDRNVMVWARPGGVDLTRPAQSFRLAEVVRQHKPDLIVAGPVYKMFEETGDRDGHLHAALCRFFDQMRERYGCAVWLETHVPMAQAGAKRVMRPIGSGIWSRWPEFGISLMRSGRKDGSLILDRFRGDRDETRQWPESIMRNPAFKPRWPWIARYPEGTFMTPMSEAS